MKKFAIILFSIIAVFVAVLAIVPIIFKDDIQKQIDKSLSGSLNAKVYYDIGSFSISVFSHFPNPSVSLGDFGIVGNGVFASDTLVNVGNFQVTMDLFSIFSGNYKVNSIQLDNPSIYVKVLEDGTANYDIAISSDTVETAPEEEGPSNMKVGIESWTINNGSLVYDDASTKAYVSLSGLNHHGKGDFSLDVFDMATKTNVKIDKILFEGTKYMGGQVFDADITMNMSLPDMKFTFKENKIKLNDFPLAFDGYFSMPENGYEMDMRFSSPESSIKSLYSLIPAAFVEGYEHVEASGTMSFEGFAKGVYSDNQMPAYRFALKTKEGYIHYPDLPDALKNINLDMLVESKDGSMEQTFVDIASFHMDFGKNPIDAKVKINNLVNYDMDANLKAKLNIGELTTMFPMDGIEARGIYSVDLSASGIYDSIRQIIPKLEGSMALENAYVKTSDLPAPLEAMSFQSSISCPTGRMGDFQFILKDFHANMNGETFTANLIFRDLIDYYWDLTAGGGIDLAMVSKLYPVEGMEYKGYAKGNINTKGRFSDVEAERYNMLPTSGSVSLKNFEYTSVDMPLPFTIKETNASFTPQSITLHNLDANMGSSDFKVAGNLSNYINYIFGENEVIVGKFALNSNRIDANEMMTGEETSGTEEEDTSALEVIEIPRDIDFTLNSFINNIYYDNLHLKNATGAIIVKDGVLNMSGLKFGLLNGTIAMDGKYDSRNKEKPLFDYAMNIQDLSMPEAFKTFDFVKTFAPMMQSLDGNFSSKFKIDGVLGKDMMPLYETIFGNGTLAIAEAKLNRESKLISNINSLSKMSMGNKSTTIRDILLSARIEDGKMKLDPFNVNLGENTALVQGAIGINGLIDYVISTDVETGTVGEATSSLLASYAGANVEASKMKVNFGVQGTYDDPKVKILKVSGADDQKATVKKEVQTKVVQEADKAKEEAKKKAEEEAERLRKQAEEEARKKKEEAEKKAKEQAKDAVKDAEDALNNLFKKKKK